MKLLQKKRASILAVLFGCLFVSSQSEADWVNAEGRYHFESNITKEECNYQALLAAKKDALSKINLEKLSAVEMEVCTEAGEQTNCVLHSQTFNYLDGGYISETRNVVQTREGVNTGNEECVAKIEANVHQYAERPDPDFFLEANISGKVKKFHGESFTITGKTSQKAHIYVFFWSPNDERDEYTTLIPNGFEPSLLSNKTFQAPSAARNGVDYTLSAEFPEDLKRDEIIEYFFVLATKTPFKTMNSESVEGFWKRLDEFGRSNWRLKHLGYSILRGDR